MKTLKVGMYARLHNGEFGQYGEFECNTNFRTNYGYSVVSEKSIKKWSDDPTELIEKGDYINGCKVLGLFTDNGERVIKVLSKIGYVYPRDIKDIMTKEMFEDRKYIIGE